MDSSLKKSCHHSEEILELKKRCKVLNKKIAEKVQEIKYQVEEVVSVGNKKKEDEKVTRMPDRLSGLSESRES